VTDTSGRGFGYANRQVAGCVSNQKTKTLLPKPDLNTVVTQGIKNLDTKNRFFRDNYKTLQKFDTSRSTTQPKQGSKMERGTLASGSNVKVVK